MLADHRLIRWYRRKANLLASWQWSAIQPALRPLAPVLPPIDREAEEAYREENRPLISAYIEAARKIAGGGLPLLSAGTVNWRAPDFWKKHPLTAAELPGGFHPYTVDHYTGGDTNLAFWASAFPFLPSLAQAYRYTNDKVFIDAICHAVDSWARARHPAANLTWEEHLTVAARATSILYTLSLVPSSALPARSVRTMSRIVRASGSILEAAVVSPSFNHWIVEAFGLFCCGLARRESRAGRRWMRKGASILQSQIRRQFFKDGVHGERSPGYMRFVIEIYLHFRALGKHHGLVFEADFDQRLAQSCEALIRLSGEQGVLANFGDDSDLNLFSGERTAATPLAIAAALFRRADFKPPAGNFPPVAFWLLGGRGYREYQSLANIPDRQDSCALPDAGFYIARSSRGAFRLTCGAEMTRTNGHSHADLFGFELEIEGDRMLVDAGSYAYNPSRQWRDYFRSTHAHNTVVVDGQDQAVPLDHDNFGWKSFPRVRVHRWSMSDSYDLFDAEHDGYARLKEPVVHRRRVLHVKADYWVIVDDLLGTGVHLAELFFQFAPLELRLDGAERALAARPWGNLEIRQLADGCDADIVTGQEGPIRGWISKGYGHREPAPSLRFAKSGSLPMRFCTVLLPVHPNEPVSVRRMDDGIEVTSSRFTDRIHVPVNVEIDAAVTLERRVLVPLSQ